jgi:hypothetical protein
MQGIEIFVVVSGSFGIVLTIPLGYLAFRSYREGQELREIQHELAEIQQEIRKDQATAVGAIQETKEKVERVGRASDYLSRRQPESRCWPIDS